MSGVEIVGLVLGVVPLLVSALEHYKGGIGTVAAVLRWRGQLDALINRLKVQRVRLYLNALLLLQASGLDTSGIYFEDDCIQLLREVGNAAMIHAYLGPMAQPFDEMMARYEDCLKLIAETLVNIRRLPGTNAGDLRALLLANPPLGGKFAFRERLNFTLEKGKLKQLIDDLKEENLNFEIYVKSMRITHKYTDAEHDLEARQVSHLKAVQRSAQLLHDAFSSLWVPGCHAEHKALVQIDSQLTKAKSFSRKLPKDVPVQFQLYLHVKQSKWQGVVVQAVDTCTQQQAQRVRDLCTALSTAHQVRKTLTMDLVNGDLYESANSSHNIPCSTESPTITLEDFFRTVSGDEVSQMEIDQCTFLALILVSSMIQLCPTPWVLKPWTSKTLHFFPNSQRDQGIETERPVVPQTLPDPTGTALTDPKPKPQENLLEMGILLLEIWHQKCMEAWISGQSISQASDLRSDHAGQWLQSTARSIDGYWREAIESCLAFGVGRRRKWDEKGFRDQLYHTIVRPLQKSHEALCETT